MTRSVTYGFGAENKLDALVDAQIFRVINNNVFDTEAEYIVTLAKLENATAVIDFGCWVGVLASEVRKRWPELPHYQLIDAVPYYIKKAKTILMQDDIPSIEVTLIPDDFNGEVPTTMLISSYDTLNSSSIYSKDFLNASTKTANVTMKLAPVNTVGEFVKDNDSLFSKNNYVKIDLDGVDIDLVNSIINANFSPAVVQFEVWNSYKPAYEKLKERMSASGYLFPNIAIEKHQHFSVAVGKHHWWAVGYDNTTASSKSYYHKSWN
jgi:hypothetical protein